MNIRVLLVLVLPLCLLVLLSSCDKKEDSIRRTYKYSYRNLSDHSVMVTAYSRERNIQTMSFQVGIGEITEPLFVFENAPQPVLGVDFKGADSVVVDYGGKVRVHIQHTNPTEQDPVEPGNILLSVYYQNEYDEANRLSNFIYEFTNDDYAKAN